MCKTVNSTVRPFVGLEMIREIAIVVSHGFNGFGKIVISVIIQFKFKLISYSTLTIITAHKNINIKTVKHMTILVMQLDEPWIRVPAELLGQDRLGGQRHL